jgi:molybdopterin-guanine dinucleotide biosynthesis protein A
MLAAVVLAGGRASRLGGCDKPLLALGADTVLAEILRRLAGQVDAVCLSTGGDVARFAAFGLPVVADNAGAGPLAGVSAALGWAAGAGATELLVVPGDTPFLPADLAQLLGPGPSVAVAGGRVHHLVCRLPVMIRPVLVAWLAQGHTRAGAFLDAASVRHVAFDAADAFLNINTPDDLAAARRRAGSGLS